MSDILLKSDSAKLGDIFTFKNGRAFKKNEWKESGLPIIRIKNLNESSAPFNYYQGDYDSAIEINNGDLLFSWSGTVGSSFGAHLWQREKGLLNQHIFKIGFKEAINTKYAYYALSEITAEIEKSVKGAVGLVHVKKSDMVNFSIYLPPLSEQGEIVEVLDTAFAAIDQAKANIEQNIANAKELFKSKLNQIFSQKGEGWVEKTLKDIGTVQTGTTPPTKDRSNYGDYMPFVKPAHFRRDGSINHGDSMLSESGLSKGRLFEARSVLMVCIGATIGKTGFTEIPVSSNQQINALTPSDDYEAKLLYYALISPFVQKQVMEVGKSAQATLPIINKSKWEKLRVNLPIDISEQRDIVKTLVDLKDQTMKVESHYQTKLASLDELKKSILQKAFAGELT